MPKQLATVPKPSTTVETRKIEPLGKVEPGQFPRPPFLIRNSVSVIIRVGIGPKIGGDHDHRELVHDDRERPQLASGSRLLPMILED
jgi:hypothetical protein